MTDRVNAFVVVLEEDMRVDDAEGVLTALRMVKGVLTVTPNVSHLGDHIAFERARRELGSAMWKVLYPKLEG